MKNEVFRELRIECFSKFSFIFLKEIKQKEMAEGILLNEHLQKDNEDFK